MKNKRANFNPVNKNFTGESSNRTKRWFPILSWLSKKLEAIIKGIAFSLRVILRNNIGSKTFSLWTILYGYIWTRIFLIWNFEILVWPEFTFIEQRPVDFQGWVDLIIFCAKELLDNLKLIYSISITPFPDPLRSFMLLFYSYVFFLAAILHKLSNDRKFRRRIPRDRNNRGDSFFLNWLTTVTFPSFNIRLKTHHVKIYIEPFCVILFGWLFFEFGDPQFGLFLITSACCLAFEEYRSYLEWREYLESIDDQEFHFKRLDSDRPQLS